MSQKKPTKSNPLYLAFLCFSIQIMFYDINPGNLLVCYAIMAKGYTDFNEIQYGPTLFFEEGRKLVCIVITNIDVGVAAEKC